MTLNQNRRGRLVTANVEVPAAGVAPIACRRPSPPKEEIMTLARPIIGAILDYHPKRDTALSGHAVRPAIVTVVAKSAGEISVGMTVFDSDGTPHARAAVPHADAWSTAASAMGFWAWPVDASIASE